MAVRALRRTHWWLVGMATASALVCVNPISLQRLDLMAYDAVIPTRQASARAPVVVAIDDASLTALGRWPWPQEVYAALVHRLGEANAAAVGLTFSCAEPRGHLGVDIGVDGKARSLFLGSAEQRPCAPSLARGLLESLAEPGLAAGEDSAMFSGLNLQGWLRRDELLLPRTAGIVVIPVADALRSPEVLAAKASGRTVFVGVTAQGLGAEINTPLAPGRARLPAVLFHAQAFDVLQNHEGIRRADALLVLALALCAVSVLALWPPDHGYRIVLAGLLLFLPIALSAWLVAAAHIWLSPALATVSLAVAWICWLARELRRTQQKLRRARRYAQATLQAMDDAVITVDARDHSIRFVNATGLHQIGAETMMGLSLPTAYPLLPDSMDRLKAAIAECLARRDRVHVPELLQLRGRAGLRALRTMASPLYSPAGRLDSVALVFTDVTDLVAATSRLDRAAHHDALTGLPNRSLLHERLGLALSRVRRGSEAAILFLDLDNFKHINDSLGHRVGDQVLQVLAHRLSTLCRDTDTVARWGGDEFVLLLEDIGGIDGAATAAAKVVEVMSQDIVLGAEFNHQRLPSAASVGVVLAPRDGLDMEELLSKADMAMYRAKAQQGGGLQFWSDALDGPKRSLQPLKQDSASAA